MIRPDRVLHRINVARWSRAEAYHHLSVTFNRAAAAHPDLLEPYMIRLAALDQREQMAIMRQALRETFATRYPDPFASK